MPIVADVKDTAKVRARSSTSTSPQIVFHAAAYKHVPMMEANPREAFENNTFATLTPRSDAPSARGRALRLHLAPTRRSSPSTVMGTSKALGERIVETLAQEQRTTKLMSVRFGNVLGSSGSVVPIFKRQIAAGGPVTVTDERMTRYFMTIPEAVRLVLQAGGHGQRRRDLRARHGRAGARSSTWRAR